MTTRLQSFATPRRSRHPRLPAELKINDTKPEEFFLVQANSNETWVWDRAIATLQKGENRIEISLEEALDIDLLNILDTGY